MKVKNIDWNVDMDEVYEVLDNMTVGKASTALELPPERYAAMTTSERHDYAYDKFHHCPGALDDFMGLPSEVEVPEEITSDPEYRDDFDGLLGCVSDWLSDIYGFCHGGFEIDEETFEVSFNVCCTASYNSYLKIPATLRGNHEGILEYIREHLDAAPVSDLEWLDDLDPNDAVTIDDIKNFGDEQTKAQERRLKVALRAAGTTALIDFLGYNPEHMTAHEVDSGLNDVIRQMPDDVYAEYIKKYLDEEVVNG